MIHYSSLPDDRDAFLPFATVDHLRGLLATWVLLSVHTFLPSGCCSKSGNKGARQSFDTYYIQDYEPYFFPIDDPQHKVAMESYEAIPEITMFADKWIKQQVESRHSQSEANTCKFGSRAFHTKKLYERRWPPHHNCHGSAVDSKTEHSYTSSTACIEEAFLPKSTLKPLVAPMQK